MDAQVSFATIDLDAEIDACFSLIYSDEERQIQQSAQRFATDCLAPFQRGMNYLVARDSIKRTAAELDLESFVLEHSGGERSGATTAQLIAAEELGAGHLEGGLDVLLPIFVAELVRAVEATLPSDDDLLKFCPKTSRAALAFHDARWATNAKVISGAGADVLLLLRWRKDGEVDVGITRQTAILQRQSDTNTTFGFHCLLFRTAEHCDLDFPHWSIPASILRPAMTRIVMTLSALLIGAMREATQFAFAYAKKRITFGKPIIGHQAVSLRLANMIMQFEASKLLLWQAASQVTQGEVTAAVRLLVSQVSEAGREIFRDAVQVCGAHGYVEGLPPPTWFQHSSALTALLRDLSLSALGQPGDDENVTCH